MLELAQYFSDNGSKYAWKKSRTREGLYYLDNAYALTQELFDELESNLEDEAEYTYQSPSGWTYKVKKDDDDSVGIIGWKRGESKQQTSSSTGGGSKSYSGSKPYTKSSYSGNTTAKTVVSAKPEPQKMLTDVEVKHTDDINTVNEILNSGYANNQLWRYEGHVNMTELVEIPNNEGVVETKMQIVPHHILVRSKIFVPRSNPTPTNSNPEPQEQEDQPPS